MNPARKQLLGFGLPVVLMITLQLVPYGRDHSNPPGREVAAWDAASTRDLARRACFDCHSNETRWPWYSSIAPVSWRIQHNVREGREKLNFTALDPASKTMTEAAGEAGEMVAKGRMPPKGYLLMHPEAWLSSADRRALAKGLEATFAGYSQHGHEGGEPDH